jgi:hypothetical protein
MSAPVYRRLPGKRRTVVSATSLYLGPDHILQVRSNRISEEYQRFYFQDVQSVVLRKSAPMHYAWTVSFVVLALLTARVSGNALWPFGILFIGAFFLWLRGPSCEVQLRTAVTSERLLSLHRLKTAQRVLPMMRDQIEGVQGRVVSAPEDYAADAVRKPPPLVGGFAPHSLSPRKRDHLYLFAYLAVEALLLGVWLARPARGLEQAIAAATLIEFFTLVIVLVRQAQQRIPAALRNATYAAMSRWLLVQGAATVLAYKAVIFDQAKITLDPMTLMRGTLTYLTFMSLAGMACVGLWFSVGDSND